MKTTTTPNPSPSRGVIALIALGALESALAIYQWIELVSLRNGGQTVCSINETVNCNTVWNSPFASKVHDLLGMPVAGVGLVWGLAALALPVALFLRERSRKPSQPLYLAIRIVAAVGALSVIPLAIGSFSAGAVCLTCLATYVFAIAYAVVAFVQLPKPAEAPVGAAVLWAGGAVLVAYLALLGPGLATAKNDTSSGLPTVAQSDSNTPAVNGPTLDPQDEGPAPEAPPAGEYLAQLPAQTQQGISNLLAEWKNATPVPAPGEPRMIWGAKDAPVKIVEWTDIRCGHCGQLSRNMHELKRVLPKGLISVEPRHYPLDKDCNPKLQGSDGTNIRCTAAKALICLEGNPDYYWRVQEQLFAEQQELSPERVLGLARPGRANLQQCMDSPETAKKLAEDLAYAEQFHISGTPLVVVNGREAAAVPMFLYALAMTKGNPDDPAWSKLPPPQPQAADNHGH